MIPEPVVRNLSLRCSQENAFAAFAEQIGQWWPRTFTASGNNLADVQIEGGVGGRVYESDVDGNEYDWGSVRVWQPGRRVTMSWTLGVRSGWPTEVDVALSGNAQACELRLEHRSWRPDQVADRARFDDAGGWTAVLDRYLTFVSRSPAS